jgi:hypothetical protein
MDSQWMQDRRGVTETHMHALDFFGHALEKTPLREAFWPAYELLAETLFSLRQAILACLEADDMRDTMHPAYHSRCLKTAQRHVDDAALQVFKLAGDALVRQSVKERGPGLGWLDQLDPARWTAERNGGLEATWDELLGAYHILFERVRLAAIAHPTGEMDQ